MIRFLYRKWIRRRCPHICACCRFRKDHYTECFTEMEQRERRARNNLGQWQYKGDPENIRRLGR